VNIHPLYPVFGCCSSAFHVIGQDLVPHAGDGVDLDPELRSERGVFAPVATSARVCALVAACPRVGFGSSFEPA
jgi:hypothetical protein